MSGALHNKRTARRQPKAIQERLLDRVARTPSGCWEWQGCRHQSGYGKMYANQKLQMTHRISYELFCGPTFGLFVCHHCDNPPCVNPAHLFLGTHRDNVQDMLKKGRAADRKGVKSGVAKICDSDVVAIRQQFADGVKRADIAAQYGVDETTIAHIARGRSWRHVPGRVASRAKPPKLSESDVKEAASLRAAGESFATIGKRFNVSAMTIIRTFKRNGIEV